ncbi:hypothetical protein C8Q76DRAFT_800833 [Earliella scabrosa]|nr:hypothetical protein C8Q76DRAFT_800833 [Earliella scabrosa]
MSATIQSTELFQIPRITSVSGAFGTVMVGTYAALILYGLFLHQTYKYFTIYEADALWIRSLVIAVIVQETLVAILHMHLGYYYFVENFGDPLVFLRGVWSLDLIPIISTCIVITCNSFYVVRIWLVGPSRYRILLVAAIVVLMVAAMATAMASTVAGFRGITITNFQNLLWLVLAYNVLASAADVILTTTLIYILHHSRTGFSRHVSDSMSRRASNDMTHVQVYGIENLVWIASMMVAERLYANSLLSAYVLSPIIVPASVKTLLVAYGSLNSRKFSGHKRSRSHSSQGHSHHGDPFGTAIRPTTTSSAQDSDSGNLGMHSTGALELPQIPMNPRVYDTTRVIDIKALPLSEDLEAS